MQSSGTIQHSGHRRIEATPRRRSKRHKDIKRSSLPPGERFHAQITALNRALAPWNATIDWQRVTHLEARLDSIVDDWDTP